MDNDGTDARGGRYCIDHIWIDGDICAMCHEKAPRRIKAFGYDVSIGKTTHVHRETVDVSKPGDYGADPIGDGTFRMVPSGDVVSLDERNRRMAGRV